MTRSNDTIRVLIPLKRRKKNGRPKIMPPAEADCGDGFRVFIEVLQRTRGYRRWPAEVKTRIVAESFQPSVRVGDVAQRHGLAAHQLSDWRRQAREGVLVLPADAMAGMLEDNLQPSCRCGSSRTVLVCQQRATGPVGSSRSRSATIWCCGCQAVFRRRARRR